MLAIGALLLRTTGPGNLIRDSEDPASGLLRNLILGPSVLAVAPVVLSAGQAKRFTAERSDRLRLHFSQIA